MTMITVLKFLGAKYTPSNQVSSTFAPKSSNSVAEAVGVSTHNLGIAPTANSVGCVSVTKWSVTHQTRKQTQANKMFALPRSLTRSHLTIPYIELSAALFLSFVNFVTLWFPQKKCLCYSLFFGIITS